MKRVRGAGILLAAILVAQPADAQIDLTGM
jgi:hypothetical protein